MRGARVGGQLGGGPAFHLDELLQTADLGTTVRALVREAFGAEAATEGTLEPIPYASGSPATGALYRLRGTTTDGHPWSLFCKVLQHVRHWPMLSLLPPEVGADMMAWFPWRSELELWDPLIMDSFPPGLRPPRLHRLVELPDDRVAVWQEDIAISTEPFDLDHYRRAAYLLGRWNARCSSPEILATNDSPANGALRQYATAAVPMRGLEPLADDELWAHPWLRDHGDLRRDLRRLAPRIPEFLDRLDAMPQCLPHGDASPQNLLIPRDEPGTVVVIDLSFRTPHALGFDLGQLLVGLVHAGEVPASRLPAIADVILPSYLRGLRAEGLNPSIAGVAWSFAIATLLRSGFDSFLYGLLDDPSDGARHTFDERVRLCGFLADRAVGTLAEANILGRIPVFHR